MTDKPSGMTPTWRTRVEEATETAIGIGILLIVVALLVLLVRPPFVAWQGIRECRSDLLDYNPDFAAGFVLGSGLWTRSIDSHWLVALTATPTDFASNDVYTIVCHYKSTNYVFDRVEVLNGDRIGRIRATSQSAANPLLYWLLADELEE